MPKEDIAVLIFMAVAIVLGVTLGWIGSRRRWGWLKSFFFIWLPLGALFGLYLLILRESLRTILLFLVGFFFVSLVYLAFFLALGTAIGKALRKLLGLDK